MAAIFSPMGPHIAARFGPRTEYGCQIGSHYARCGPSHGTNYGCYILS